MNIFPLSLLDKIFILLIVIGIAQLVQLMPYLPTTQKQRKKRYYKRLIRDIERQKNGIWDMELRMTTIKEIREGIRRQFDNVSGGIKAYAEQIEKAMTELGIQVKIDAPDKKDERNTRVELENIKKVYPPLELAGLNPEAKAKFSEKAAQETRELRRDWLKMKTGIENMAHGEERKKKEEKFNNLGNKILHTIELKQSLETDAQHMKEQMVGKWIEKEQIYAGGIDQEIKEIGGKVAGGRTFQNLVKDELKRL